MAVVHTPGQGLNLYFVFQYTLITHFLAAVGVEQTPGLIFLFVY
jgi:hypothetical protein